MRKVFIFLNSLDSVNLQHNLSFLLRNCLQSNSNWNILFMFLWIIECLKLPFVWKTTNSFKITGKVLTYKYCWSLNFIYLVTKLLKVNKQTLLFKVMSFLPQNLSLMSHETGHFCTRGHFFARGHFCMASLNHRGH